MRLGRQKKNNILIADDEIFVHKFMKSCLQQNPLNNVDTVVSAEQAVEATTDFFYDVVFLDLNLPCVPGETPSIDVGFKTLKQIHKIQPQTQLITISGYSGHHDLDFFTASLESGACLFLAKPLSYQQLNAALKMALGYSSAYHIDGLTKLMNSSYLFECLERDYKRMERGELNNIFFWVIGINNLNKITTIYGTKASNLALQTIGKLFKPHSYYPKIKAYPMIRESDLVARLGNEEFGGYLTNIFIKDFFSYTKRIVKNLTSYQYGEPLQKRFSLDISLGIRSVNKHQQQSVSVEDLVKSAYEFMKVNSKIRLE